MQVNIILALALLFAGVFSVRIYDVRLMRKQEKRHSEELSSSNELSYEVGFKAGLVKNILTKVGKPYESEVDEAGRIQLRESQDLHFL